MPLPSLVSEGSPRFKGKLYHYNDVIMSSMASQITGDSIVYSAVCSGADQRKHQSSASLAYGRGVHRWPVTRKMFPFEDVIILFHATYEMNKIVDEKPAFLTYCTVQAGVKTIWDYQYKNKLFLKDWCIYITVFTRVMAWHQTGDNILPPQCCSSSSGAKWVNSCTLL